MKYCQVTFAIQLTEQFPAFHHYFPKELTTLQC